MEKTSRKAKAPPVEFKVTTSKNLLINNQAITSMRNLTTTLAYPNIPTYNWTFSSIPNWTWYCSSLLSFVAQISNLWLTPLHGSQYVLTLATWLIVVGYNVLHKWWRLGSTWLQNPKAHKCSSFSLSIRVLGLYFRVWWLLK